MYITTEKSHNKQALSAMLDDSLHDDGQHAVVEIPGFGFSYFQPGSSGKTVIFLNCCHGNGSPRRYCKNHPHLSWLHYLV